MGDMCTVREMCVCKVACALRTLTSGGTYGVLYVHVQVRFCAVYRASFEHEQVNRIRGLAK